MNNFDIGLNKLRELTGKLTENGYLIDRAEQWEFALDAVPDLIFIVNQNYKIKFINKALAKRLGVDEDGVINKSCCDIFTNKKNVCLCRINISTSTLLNYDFEKDTTFDGAINLGDIYIDSALTGWFNFTRSPILDDDGDLLGFICVLRDIAKRVKASEKLRKSEEKYRTIHDTAPLAFIGWDLSCNITEWNRNAERVFGWKKKEILGQNFYELIVPDQTKNQFECVIKDISEDHTENIVSENVTKDGRIIICEWYNSVLHDCSGKPIGVISLVSDISSEKEKEKLIRSIFKASLSGIGLIKNRIIQWSNKKLRELTGYNEKELYKQSVRMLYGSDEEYDRVGKVMCDRLSKDGYGYIRTIWRKKDGTLMNVLLSSAQVDEENISKDVIFTVTDITNWDKQYKNI